MHANMSEWVMNSFGKFVAAARQPENLRNGRPWLSDSTTALAWVTVTGGCEISGSNFSRSAAFEADP